MDLPAQNVFIPADGSTHQLIFSRDVQEITVYSSSESNESSRISLSIFSTAELIVNATSKKVRKSASIRSIANETTGWDKRGIKFFSNGSPISSFRIGGSQNVISKDPNCFCLTEEEINEKLIDPGTIATLNVLGYPVTRDGLCSFYKNTTGTMDCSLFGEIQNQSQSTTAIGIEMRDSCDKQSKTVARFVIKPKVDFNQLRGSLVANISFKSEPYLGEKAASIKPVSDGIWEPDPIFLFQTLQQHYGPQKEYVRVTRWNKKGISKILDLSDGISDVLYNGFYLHRVRASRALRMGGKATVEIRSHAGLTYGFCMPLKKRRQNFGSYELN